MSKEEKVLEVFKQVFNNKTIDIQSQKEDIEEWDSLGHLQLIMQIESAFGIKFKTYEMNNIRSVQDAIEQINKLSSTK